MKSIQKRRLEVQLLLRELSNQLARLNRQVGGRVELKETDLGCLDILARHGPLSPSALARLTQVHPATLTGILDRLEASGWIVRDRDPTDRRGVLLRALGGRAGELRGLYAGMNSAVGDICDGYDEHDLGVIAEFMANVTRAAEVENEKLAGA
jgi:DNA-binding MarR family transcriptional regulator